MSPCPRCGRPLEPSLRFCLSCGAAVETAATATPPSQRSRRPFSGCLWIAVPVPLLVGALLAGLWGGPAVATLETPPLGRRTSFVHEAAVDLPASPLRVQLSLSYYNRRGHGSCRVLVTDATGAGVFSGDTQFSENETGSTQGRWLYVGSFRPAVAARYGVRWSCQTSPEIELTRAELNLKDNLLGRLLP